MSMQWEKLLCAERLGQRPAKSEEGRSPFHSDHDKIIFSGAFRRLARKTQVHPLAINDHVHNRLTHSLEVACVGRTLGMRVGKALRDRGDLPEPLEPSDIGDIVQSSCLAHDIGNPPFGHTGEEAIRNWFQKDGAGYLKHLERAERDDLRMFEGNAQGLRVLTTSEYYQHQEGMRLTYATLSAAIKYPWCAVDSVDRKRPKQSKYGVFQSELEYFHEIAKSTGLLPLGDNWYCRHPLVYLMEAADDFCYGIVDLEDGLEMGIVRWEEIYALLRPVLDPAQARDLEQALDRVDVGRKPAILRGKVIDAFITAATEAFMANQQDFLAGRVKGDLISLCEPTVRDAVQAAKDLAKDKIFNHAKRVELEIGAYNTIATLLSTLCGAVDALLGDPDKVTYKDKRVLALIGENSFHPDVFAKRGSYQYLSLMAVIDYISGMTDNYATNLAKQFNGMGAPRY
ncbi:deoxyguanosinetriphosphate triphosphohydrolase [Marinimicrobium alkaliphilum]|uniref:deoxyguanosinetriphosphate triphosphohydrolase n=1 Tax=Marinimicrobium alkaliphilum TaxID=2202654 RepID=UPI0018E0A1EC|nr:deoxyguanosinetriphosphate triphosphohydrolase [Marinimicrobium alkaliphilum]